MLHGAGPAAISLPLVHFFVLV